MWKLKVSESSFIDKDRLQRFISFIKNRIKYIFLLKILSVYTFIIWIYWIFYTKFPWSCHIHTQLWSLQSRKINIIHRNWKCVSYSRNMNISLISTRILYPNDSHCFLLCGFSSSFWGKNPIISSTAPTTFLHHSIVHFTISLVPRDF